MGIGAPPANWAALMAEMMVTDYPRSLSFWTGPLGFAVAFERPAQKLACLVHSDGAQVMIYQRDGDWETGPMDVPYGCGAVIQVYVGDADAMADAIRAAGVPFYVAPRENGAIGATVWAGSANFWCRTRMAIWSWWHSGSANDPWLDPRGAWG
jgi:catechol 2,3-dioxygenase-like lactoylglutathione lyase family enzyme